MVELCTLFYQLWPHRRKLWVVVALAMMAWIGWNEFQHYFLDFTPRSFFDENTLTAQILADYLKTKPADTDVCFMGAPIMGDLVMSPW